jgi:hypothetical protein
MEILGREKRCRGGRKEKPGHLTPVHPKNSTGPPPPPPDLFTLAASLLAAAADAGADALASAGICEAEARKAGQEWVEGVSAARAAGGGARASPAAAASAASSSSSAPPPPPPPTGRVPTIVPIRPLGDAVAALDAEVAAARAAVARLKWEQQEGGGGGGGGEA